MQFTIYDYFAQNYGKLETKSTALEQKYKNCTKNQLKKSLKQLKTQPANQIEIKYVSKILRSQYKRIKHEEIDHKTCYTKKFWKYCEITFESQGDVIKSDFNEDTCYKYLKKAFQNHHDVASLYRHGSNGLIFQKTNSITKHHHIEK